jgi:TPR repeat protein
MVCRKRCRRAIVPPMRLRHLLAFLTLALALGAAHANSAAPAPAHPVQSEYDLGVEAFRAEDYVQARRHWQSCALEADAPPEAFNNLGYLLHEGLGGAADPEGGVAL